MEVRGYMLISLQGFILDNFEEEGWDSWFGKLSKKAQKVYSFHIYPKKWYDMKSLFLDPLSALLDLFYSSRRIGAREVGAYIAEFQFSNYMRIFLQSGTEKTLFSVGANILGEHYRPCKFETVEQGTHHWIYRIHEFADMNEIFEDGLHGWLYHAITSTTNSSVKIQITSSLLNGDPYTEYKATWE